jgi:hypothetical protein
MRRGAALAAVASNTIRKMVAALYMVACCGELIVAAFVSSWLQWVTLKNEQKIEDR